MGCSLSRRDAKPSCVLGAWRNSDEKLDPSISPNVHRSVLAAINDVRELIVITDSTHHIRFMNSSMARALEYSMQEIADQPFGGVVQDSFDLSSLLKTLEQGSEWSGRIRMRTKSGESIPLSCRSHPVEIPVERLSYFVHMMEIPLDLQLSRGSVSSLRKGSYDKKSLISEAGSARRQSLAKLHSLPLEAPITKVFSLLCEAQEYSSSIHVFQKLEEVMEILRTTELFTSQLKADSMMREDPLTTSLIEALITKGSNSAMMPLESSNDPTFLAQIIAKKNAGVTVPASRKIREALKKIDTWDYDVITVEKFSNCRPLICTGSKIFALFDACKILNTDWSTLHMWLDLMEANYNRNVPYHNSTHAADVLQATAYFLLKLKSRGFFDELTEMCCLIAAVCHDIDHPGKNNHFLNNSGALLSLLYNDASVLEQHHASLTFRLTLADESVNIFKGLPASSYSSARSMIVDLIMSTDMMRHIEHYSKFATIYKKSPEETSQKGAKLVEPTDMTSDDIIVLRRMVIKCADVANPTRPLKLCKQWTSRICEEYFQQADEEKAKNYPLVMEAFDRQSCSIPATQLAFITIFVNDMMREWDNFLGVPELIHHLNKNHSYWKELHDKGCKKIEEDKS